jgi:hypothetical protein
MEDPFGKSLDTEPIENVRRLQGVLGIYAESQRTSYRWVQFLKEEEHNPNGCLQENNVALKNSKKIYSRRFGEVY